MILGIDATNIRAGGGLTHLKEILINADPNKFGFQKVIVWSNNETLSKLPNYAWLQKETHAWLNKSFVFSFLFQIVYISKLAKRKYNCSLLFVPGSSFLGSFKNTVVLSQNMLPFEKTERDRFPNWKSKLRFKILYYTQSYSFKHAKGVIFLTKYAKEFIAKSIKLSNNTTIIPHGINLNFKKPPNTQFSIDDYSEIKPFKLLYVSIVTVYKHQWNVAEAVLRLRAEGYPIELELVGGATKESLDLLNNVIEADKEGVINYKGLIPYEQLENVYKEADGFVFASSCENLPIILIEAMTAGLPIASSNMGPMPEVLGDDAFYFNPLKTSEIYKAIKLMLDSNDLRSLNAQNTYKKSINYTWKSCSDNTFEYLSEIAKQSL